MVKQEKVALVSGPMARGHAPGARHVLQIEARAGTGQDEAVVTA